MQVRSLCFDLVTVFIGYRCRSQLLIEFIQPPAEQIQIASYAHSISQMISAPGITLIISGNLRFLLHDLLNKLQPFLSFRSKVLTNMANHSVFPISGSCRILYQVTEITQGFYYKQSSRTKFKRNGKVTILLYQSWLQFQTVFLRQLFCKKLTIFPFLPQ